MAWQADQRRELLQLTFWFVICSDILLLGWWNMLLPAATLVLLLLLLGSGAIWLILLRRRGLALLRTPLDMGMLLLTVTLGLSSYVALDPSRSWRFAWQWLACIWLYYLSVTLFRAGWSLRAFGKGLLLTLAVSLIGAYFQLYGLLSRWYAAGPWPDPLPPTLPRIWGLTVSPNVLAIMLVCGVLMALGYWRSGTGRRPWPLMGWFVVVTPMLILPASRSGWLALLVGLFVYAGLDLYRRPAGQRLDRRILLRFLGASLLGGLLLLLLIGALRGQTLQLDKLDSAFYRSGFWQIAWSAWQEAPLLGTGLNSYATHYLLAGSVPRQTLFVAAHNIYFQALADMGAVGLLAVLVITGQMVWLLWRTPATRFNEWVIGLIAALAAFFVHALFDTPETWIMAMAALLLGATVAQLAPQGDKFSMARWERLSGWLPALWPASWAALLATGFLGYQVSQQYFLATEAAQAGQWETALTHLDLAQSLTPYDDSSVLAFSALLRGGLAATNPAQLPAAVAEFGRLVALEPGWGAHRANLAALRWQAGQKAAAVDLMADVVAQTPAVAIYQLNLLQWQAELGEADPAGWQNLLALPQTWPDAPLWNEVGLQSSAPKPLNEAEQALIAGDLAAAEQLYMAQVAADPYDPEAQLGLGISQLQLGQDDAAAASLRRAAILYRLGSIVGSGGAQVGLWQAFRPAAPAEQHELLAQQLREQSPYGAGLGGQGSYTLTVLLRLSPPADLLPQLRCFTVVADWGWALQLAADWQAREASADSDWLNEILYGDGDGTVSCWAASPE